MADRDAVHPFAAVTDIEAFKRDFAARLPVLLQRAALRYQQLAASNPAGAAPKVVAEHQAACRAALGHLETLLKIARAVAGGGVETAADPPPDDLDALVAEARAAVAALPDEDD